MIKKKEGGGPVSHEKLVPNNTGREKKSRSILTYNISIRREGGGRKIEMGRGNRGKGRKPENLTSL